MARRLLPFLLAVLSVACGLGVGDVTTALSPSSPAPASTTVGASPSGAEPVESGKAPIVVRTPQPGDEIVSPVTISGTADVFEATVSVVILDAGGQTLAATFTTATCGGGCRGRFSTALSFFTEVRQAGTIEVFESSAEDGSPLHLVSIPVTLVSGT